MNARRGVIHLETRNREQPLSSDGPITVLIVDDHPVVLEGLKNIIEAEPDMALVGEARNGADAVDIFFRLRPAVVVMDLMLPDISGTEAIHQICSRSSNAQIIVLTSVAGDEDIYRAIEVGARGFLFKDMARRELADAIRAVFRGRRFVSPQVGARLAENLPRPQLTLREIEVLQLVAGGMRNKEIAFQLSLSEATVNAHIKHILEKLGASDRTHAVTKALRRGLIKL
jgi:two-component system NarL family response regulator